MEQDLSTLDQVVLDEIRKQYTQLRTGVGKQLTYESAKVKVVTTHFAIDRDQNRLVVDIIFKEG